MDKNISAISKEEKSKIRSKLLLTVDEENNQLALQNAVIIGKISRNEYPLDWYVLFSLS